HDGNAWLEDAGLLARDGGEGASELRDVIERDARDGRGQGGGEDVRGVEPAAQADLDDGYLDARAREGEKGRERRRLEEGELGRAVEDLFEKGDEELVVDGGLGDADALGEAAEVRRGVEAHALALGVEHRGEH